MEAAGMKAILFCLVLDAFPAFGGGRIIPTRPQLDPPDTVLESIQEEASEYLAAYDQGIRMAFAGCRQGK
jgi:hypothetical protein